MSFLSNHFEGGLCSFRFLNMMRNRSDKRWSPIRRHGGPWSSPELILSHSEVPKSLLSPLLPPPAPNPLPLKKKKKFWPCSGKTAVTAACTVWHTRFSFQQLPDFVRAKPWKYCSSNLFRVHCSRKSHHQNQNDLVLDGRTILR